MPQIPVIQYASDLHLEFYANVPRDGEFFRKLVIPAPNVDILVLAGDIGHAGTSITQSFLGWCCLNWKYVIWVYGNHEYYNKKTSDKWRYSKAKTMTELEHWGTRLRQTYPNLHVLNKEYVRFPEFPEFVFLGATLWTHIPKVHYGNIGYNFSDFKYICQEYTVEENYKPLTPAFWANLHMDHLKYILDTLSYFEHCSDPLQFVIITHHLPSYDMILDHFKLDDFNYGFATNLDYVLQKPQISAWICGHSHGQKQIPKGPCYLNARGYPNEQSQQTYNPSKCITLEPPRPLQPIKPLQRIPEEREEMDLPEYDYI